MSMKSVTGCKYIIVAILMLCHASSIQAQSYLEENPMDIAVIKVGSDSLHAIYSEEVEEFVKIIGEQTAMNAMLTKVKDWGKEYNTYLATVTPFLKSISLTQNLYAQGAALIQNTILLTRVIEKHPEGMAAALPMTNLYIETAMAFLKTYTTFKKVITKGGSDNMLKASERVELLWIVADSMRELNKKMKDLAYAIAIYDFEDLWGYVTQGMIERDAKQHANDAFRRWQKGYRRYHDIIMRR